MEYNACMSKKLVIIEAPGKLPKFKKALGKDYDVVATVGHCVDLPEKGLSINIKKQFEPTWEVKSDKKSVIKNIKAQAKNADVIFLMTDEDREGEAIAWHIAEQLKGATKAQIFRATTNEITTSGITKAINSPGQIDLNKIDAYLCRRLLDRLCGYKTSYLTFQATGGRSAGRVQSAILRIIVDREKEIISFVPEEYWVLTANLLNSEGLAFAAVLTDKIHIPNEQQATAIYDKVVNGKPFIKNLDIKNVNVNAYAPFTTIPMQATASTVYGWSGSRTMKVAQHLYEQGFITYMRTDSPVMAKEAVDATRAYIDHNYGAKYLPSKPPVYAAKKGAQEAHECCRVTDVQLISPPGLDSDHQKLYQLIWKRTVASQMQPGIDERIKATVDISGYDFIARGNRVIFDGFRKVWDVGKNKDSLLPKLTEGEKCDLKSLEKEQKFTSPPPRYSIASLGKKCEDEQIARPATFSGFLDTLQKRGYIQKTKTSFQATELGIKVIDFLTAANFCFVDVKFTSEMEGKLDEVQSNSKPKLDVLNEFWTRLKQDIDHGKHIKQAQSETEYICPECGGKLLLKQSKFGQFFSCEHYKKKKSEDDEGKSCSYTANVGEHGEPVEKVAKKAPEVLHFACKNCGSEMLKRTSKFGEFAGCSQYPKCKTTADLDGNFKEPKNYKKYKKSQDTGN